MPPPTAQLDALDAGDDTEREDKPIVDQSSLSTRSRPIAHRTRIFAHALHVEDRTGHEHLTYHEHPISLKSQDGGAVYSADIV
ncbi:hypothetical protein BDZ89DRAFT_1065209, partial [Hymenopellis radicata]